MNQNKGCLFGFLDILEGLFNPNRSAEYEPVQENYNAIPRYRRKYLLTRNELYFYKELKKVADKLNLSVLAKIRMADLVEPANYDNKGFAKIKAKHVDFALCNPENMYVLLLIELDDNSHNSTKRAERDAFVEAVYEQTGYTLMRACGTQGLEAKITALLQQNNSKL